MSKPRFQLLLTSPPVLWFLWKPPKRSYWGKVYRWILCIGWLEIRRWA